MEDNKTVRIYSYKKVWKVEKKIYSISNIPLPTPVNPYDLLAYLGVALFMLILSSLLPALTAVPAILRFVVLPFGIGHYAMKMKLDGKNPFKFLIGCIIYLLMEKGAFLQLFKRYPEKDAKVTLKWNCSKGILHDNEI